MKQASSRSFEMRGEQHSIKDVFAEDVRDGLSSSPKYLSSKYFYDDEGSRLFQKIMTLPEYYLTGCEFEIFSEQASEIFAAFSKGRNGAVPAANVHSTAFDLIELGAGDGTKTALLIDHFLKQKTDFTYSPIDISHEAIDSLAAKFNSKFPDLKMEPRVGDYFQTLQSLKNGSGRRKILLFLGSNIGNFSRAQSLVFFRHINEVMNNDDLLFVGFDLQKDPHVIVRAYDDSEGVTAAFNLNLLRRINRELGANFDLENFSHYASYQPVECAARSFLISRSKQTVYIETLGQSFEFHQWEPIFVEISQKYSLSMIDQLAAESGFEIVRNFFDSRNYYTDSLWRPGQNRLR